MNFTRFLSKEKEKDGKFQVKGNKSQTVEYIVVYQQEINSGGYWDIIDRDYVNFYFNMN